MQKGRDELLRHTIDGVPPGMPAKGLCRDCSEVELGQAVDYMLEKSLPALEE